MSIWRIRLVYLSGLAVGILMSATHGWVEYVWAAALGASIGYFIETWATYPAAAPPPTRGK